MKRFLVFTLVVLVAFIGCPPPDTGGEVNKYSVTFDSNGGSEVESIENVTHGSTVTKPDNPTKNGHAFNNWYKNEELTQVWDFDNDTVTGNITLYAKWIDTTQPLPLTINLWNSPNFYTNEDIEFGEVLPGNFVSNYLYIDDDHEFVGLYRNYANHVFSNEWNISSPIEEILTLWAKYKYRVTFNIEGSEEGIWVAHGNKAVYEGDTPEKDGWEFKGWNLEGFEFDFDTIITEPIELVARFEEKAANTGDFYWGAFWPNDSTTEGNANFTAFSIDGLTAILNGGPMSDHYPGDGGGYVYGADNGGTGIIDRLSTETTEKENKSITWNNQIGYYFIITPEEFGDIVIEQSGTPLYPGVTWTRYSEIINGQSSYIYVFNVNINPYNATHDVKY
ncbi:MAG: InlB B-repeat-containing protein [Treponema sp.]|jgi:uncharacterized repeat protein (TIGR02543 family)|nr:InlB B-repeat-containing protein [Treponema sp.]